MPAVSSGNPAATSDPNVIIRTRAAMATPIASLDVPPAASCVTSPEYSTPIPAAFALSPAVSNASRAASLMSAAATV